MLSIVSDLSIPQQLDRVSLTIERAGRVEHQRSYPLDPTVTGYSQLPATLALLAHEQPELPVLVVVEGRRGADLRVRRRARTHFIPEQSLLLRLALLRRCVAPDPPCGPNETCTEHGCRPIDIDPRTLPPYSDEAAGAGLDGSVDAARDGTIRDGGEGDASGSDATAPLSPYVENSEGWSWQAPTPQGSELNAVWGRSPTEVWFAGAEGLLMRYDGKRYWGLRTGVDVALRGVWATTTDDVWAVGEAGTIVRCIKASCATVPSSSTSVLHDVHGSAAGDVWAVGSNAAALRWTGSAWAPIGTGEPNYVKLNRVWVGGPTDVWIAGNNGRLLRYDGSFKSIPGGPSAHLRGLSVAGGEAVVVGDGGTFARYDFQTGGGWSVEAIPGANGINLQTVSGNASGALWVGGDAGALFLREAGKWNSVQPPSPHHFYRLWSATDQLWVVQQWSGASHKAGASQPLVRVWGGTFKSMQGIFGDGKDLWAVSEEGLHRYDGTGWTLTYTSPQPLRAISGAGGQLWLVGDAGTVLVRDAKGAITPVATGKGDDWLTVYAVGNDVWIASRQTLLRRAGAGGSWVEQSGYGTLGDLRHLHGSAPDNVWIFGDKSTARFDGANFTVHAQGAWAGWVFSKSDVWTSRSGGSLRHFDGSNWAPATLGDQSLTAFCSDAPGKLWAVGRAGLVGRYEDGGWRQVPSGYIRNLRGVWANAAGEVWLAGEKGTILYRAKAP